MNRIRAIRSDADHKAALARIDALMDAVPGTPEGDELDVLADLVEHYEEKHVPIGHPSPAAAIRFRMEQAELSPRDLVPIIGSRAKVSEVLSGKRELTLKMARALHRDLGIPAESLLQEPGRALPRTMTETQWDRFPLRTMAKLGWIAGAPGLADRAEEIMRDLMRRAGGEGALVPLAMWRESEVSRTPTPRPRAVSELATRVGVHPAVVAGRVRHETRNYRLLAQFIGNGQVRRQFGL